MQTTVYGWPGEGAIEYARQYIVDLPREEALPIIHRLLKEPSDDKRVKRCDYCGYPWRDGSKRNTKRTCSDECKTGIKTLQRRQQRADKALLTGKTKKRTKRDEYYIWWLEYPFWINEYEMLKNSWKYEKSMDEEGLSYIRGKQQLYGKGNRKRKTHDPGKEDDDAARDFNKRTIQKLRGR
ncbi:hypothetical protein [Brevibacillus sp. BC25]|uniref:hypothetical protein n=1 Tax=Brevibacillus sp. BC25 TaxID=1144308 RepID=UPI000270DD65|nr:hypothetical protein [Brevibacillus sp. BC25]EJL31790.1 hypothetical protein PMI05_00555 [Brevibacillus sp. BC25]